jgi:hypothetical protein
MFRSQNLDVAAVSGACGDALWVRVRRASRRQMNDAVSALARTHRVQCRAIRSLVP